MEGFGRWGQKEKARNWKADDGATVDPGARPERK